MKRSRLTALLLRPFRRRSMRCSIVSGPRLEAPDARHERARGRRAQGKARGTSGDSGGEQQGWQETGRRGATSLAGETLSRRERVIKLCFPPPFAGEADLRCRYLRSAFHLDALPSDTRNAIPVSRTCHVFPDSLLRESNHTFTM